MIKSLQVINYQPWKDVTLVFDPHVNVIKGTSHEGKSSLMRALQWELENDPSGFGFRSYFAGKEETFVGTEFDNGTVTRQRDDRSNSYSISKGDQELTLEALRSGVPEEVRLLTNMSYLNIQMQDDGYFLLTDPPGQVAKSLNNIVGLEIIDEVAKRAEQKVRGTQSKITALENDIVKKEEEISKYDVLEDVKDRIIQADVLLSEIKYDEEREEKISNLVSQISDQKEKNRELENFLKMEPKIIALKEKAKEIQILTKNKSDVEDLVFSLKDTYGKLRKIKLWLKIEPKIASLKEKALDIVKTEENRRHLFSLCQSIRQAETVANSSNEYITNLEQRAAVLKKMLDKCPTCGASRQYWTKGV